MTNITVKYQLPNEDLDALISVTTDEDVENMMDEYDRVAGNRNPRSARLRLFLFPETEAEGSRASSISSLLNGSVKRESWFLDALNGGVSEGLERGRSEASSLVSEVPDYLFGLDNSDETNHHQREPRPKDRPVLQDNVSNSDPGSPAPVVSSPFCSTSSAPCVPSIPNLPPVKTKLANSVPDKETKKNPVESGTGGQPNPIPIPYPNNPSVRYAPDAAYSGHSVPTIPVYYIPGSVQPGTVPFQPVPIQAPYPYVPQSYHPVAPAQVPFGYHHLVPGSGQVYGGGAGLRHVIPEQPFSPSAVVAHNDIGMKQHVFQAVPNSGAVPVYPTMKGGDEPPRSGAE